MGPRKLHAWARNETTRTPSVVITLSTMPGTRRPAPGTSLPSFRWALAVTWTPDDPGSDQTAATWDGTSRDQLATDVDQLCEPGERTWLYAHGLAVHLSASGLLDRLSARGWVPVRNALDGPAPSVELGYGASTSPSHSRSQAALKYHKEQGIPVSKCRSTPGFDCPHRITSTEYQRRLVIADAGAVWPRTTLNDLAADLGQDCPALPAAPDDPAWPALARREARLLLDALTITLDWWDANDCGNWGKTGATSGWNAMRHRMGDEPVFVDITHPAVPLERAACHGGRRGLFRHGQAPPGTYEELDFYRAYTVIARDEMLPRGRRAGFTSLPLDHCTLTTDNPVVGMIAEVTISRGGGRYPKKQDGRTWYPDGRFRTVLAGPDIRDAHRRGVLEKIHRGQWYTLGRTMAPWAEWCLAEQENPQTPPVVVRMLKHHGRAVIGKTAAHSYAHQDLGPAHHLGFKAEPAVVGPQRVTGWMIDLGGKRTLTYPDGDGDESFPAILAYVESHVRVRLSQVIDTLGTGIAVQCDTDGLIVNIDQVRTRDLPALPDIASPGMPYRIPQVIQALTDLVHPLRIREKTVAGSFAGTGPQHYQLGTSRKRSGIPGNARPDGKGNLTGTTYPSLMEQACRGQPDTYVPQPWSGTDPPCVTARWVLASGRTVAPEMCLTANGDSHLLPWTMTAAYHAGLDLGPVQDPVLTALATDPGPGWHGTPWTHDDLAQLRTDYD